MRTKVDFQELLNYHSKYSLEKQMDIFAWMIRTGWDYGMDLTTGSTTSMFEWLYGLSSIGVHPHYCFEYGPPEGVEIRSFLRQAFMRAVIDTRVYMFVEDWRKAERVVLGKYRMLDLPEFTRFTSLAYVRLPKTPIGRELNTQ